MNFFLKNMIPENEEKIVLNKTSSLQKLNSTYLVGRSETNKIETNPISELE